MGMAQILLRLWKLRLWVLLGVVFAGAAAAAMLTLAKSTVYAAASTQMVVDSPRSALGDAQTDLTPFTMRAIVYARLMTSPEALEYIGKAAGVDGSLIAADGPAEIGVPQASHAPSAVVNGKQITPKTQYSLRFDQNPVLPTVDVYAQAPTTQQAVRLANGAVSGFAKYLSVIESQGKVPGGSRVQVRQLGGASGGVVDPGTSKKVALLAFIILMALWCCLVLYASRVIEEMRAAKRRAAPVTPEPAVGTNEVHDAATMSAFGASMGALDPDDVRLLNENGSLGAEHEYTRR
jgi:hypothetical protein